MSSCIRERTREASKVTWIGFFLNLALSAFKMCAGILGNSAAMIADSVHSLSDLITDVIVLVGIKAASKPQDEGHDYGHGKIETLATFFVAVFLLLVGAGILYAASTTIVDVIDGGELRPPGAIALVAAAISILVKEGLFWYTRFVSRKTGSKALMANAWHHRTDSLSSVATFLGIGAAILLGGKWAILDPIAAVLVTFLIFWIAIRLAKGSLDELLEASLDRDTEDRILAIASSIDGIENPHNLKTRSLGNRIAIDIHVRIGSELPVRRAHDICVVLENSLRSEFGQETLVNVHVEPCRNCKP
ncbi:MAG: cation transporter [Candidatus Thermoplasmatota archaeon]|nr:cation transporter [Candidatus Thermoplasmatota archaeon]